MDTKEEFLAKFPDLGTELGHHYDITGRQISFAEWAWRFQDKNYQVVMHTEKHGILVSTVWLGLDHGWLSARPIIFETMIFGGRFESGEYQERYATLEDALAGHKRACGVAFSWHSRVAGTLRRWRR